MIARAIRKYDPQASATSPWMKMKLSSEPAGNLNDHPIGRLPAPRGQCVIVR
jgi:hypothetical protein